MKTKTRFSVASTKMSETRLMYHEAWLTRWPWPWGFGRMVLEDENLTHARLGGVPLGRACFVRCDLSRSKLSALDFERAEFIDCVIEEALVRVDFKSATLDRCSFNGSFMRWTGFDGATVSGGSFDNAELIETIWDFAKVRSVSFRGANMLGARLSGGHFVDCDFRDVDLGGRPSRSIPHARFERCDFRGARLSEPRHQHSVFVDCTFDDEGKAYR